MKRAFPPVLVALILVLVTSAAPVSADESNPPYYSVTTIALEDGSLVDQVIINGPPNPPPGYELERTSVALPEPNVAMAAKVLTVPAYEWTFGCSATSAAMIAGYYDRTGFANIYTGPTNGGVMPLNSSAWGTWTDSYGDTYRQCPLAASRSGLDGRTTRGSMDDYWVYYMSSVQDPYITGNWTQHTYGTAIGDYMRTSQSTYGNVDGATVFYRRSGSSVPLTCAEMAASGITQDGTYGRKLFYEARGYTVTDCYNQPTDNTGSGFTFAQYKAEIDAGRPVMLNLTGHTVVGFGYDDASKTIYLHDTWDSLDHTMTWSGSYTGLTLQSVSIVNLQCTTPGAVGGLAAAPVDEDRIEITWAAVSGAAHYELWYAVDNPYFAPGANCSNPGAFGCTIVAGTRFEHASPGNTTYVLRAVNACGTASPASADRAGVFQYDLVRGS